MGFWNYGRRFGLFPLGLDPDLKLLRIAHSHAVAHRCTPLRRLVRELPLEAAKFIGPPAQAPQSMWAFLRSYHSFIPLG